MKSLALALPPAPPIKPRLLGCMWLRSSSASFFGGGAAGALGSAGAAVLMGGDFDRDVSGELVLRLRFLAGSGSFRAGGCAALRLGGERERDGERES